MLKFKQYLKLLEDLNPLQKNSVSSWLGSSEAIPDDEIQGSKRAVELSRHIIPEGQNHIIIPAHSPVINQIQDHLSKHGYEIHNYSTGTARKIGDQSKIVSMTLDQLKSKIQKDRIKDPDLQFEAEQHAHNEAQKVFTPEELHRYNTSIDTNRVEKTKHEIAMTQFDDKKRQQYNTLFNIAKQNYLKPHLDREVDDDEIAKTGFKISNGIATKKSNVKLESIGSLLEKTHADDRLIRDFANDNRKLNSSIDQYNYIISRNPYHVAECSTNKPWKSCAEMEDDGTLKQTAAIKLPNEIQEGTHVAYMVHKNHEHLPIQQQIDRAVSRVLLKPYVSDEDHRVLFPENASYSEKNKRTITGDSDKNVSMIRMLEDFVGKHFPLRDEEYHKVGSLYDDDKNLKLYSPEYKKKLQQKLLDRIEDDNWSTEDITSAVENNIMDTNIRNALQKAYLNRLNSKHKITIQEIDHANYNGYHKNSLHQDALKNNIINQINNNDFDLSEAGELLSHSKRHGYYDDKFLHLLKNKLSDTINDWNFNNIPEAKQYGFYDPKLHDDLLKTNFRNFLEHELDSNDTDHYVAKSIAQAVDHNYLDNDLTPKIQKHVLDYIQSKNYSPYYHKEFLDNIFKSGLMSKDHIENMNDADKDRYNEKFALANDLVNKISKSKYFKDFDMTGINSIHNFYNIKMHKKLIQDKISQQLGDKFNTSLIDKAIKNGFFDWTVHKNITDDLISKGIKNSNPEITFAKKNFLWNDKIHDAEFQSALLNDINLGKYKPSILDEAIRNHLLSKEHVKALPKGLLTKIESGKHDIHDLLHAENNHYLKGDHIDALSNGLSKLVGKDSSWKDLYVDNIHKLIEHAISNEYFNDDHRNQISNIFTNLAKSGELSDNIKNHARLHGYYPTSLNFTSKF